MITIRNNTSQLIEVTCGGAMRVLLPDGDLQVSPDAIDSGQLQHLAETGWVTIVVPESSAEAQPEIEAAAAAPTSARAAKKTAKKKP